MVYKKIEKIIKADGWKLNRITGSHYQYVKEGWESTVEIPRHKGKNLPPAVMKNLEKTTGLSF